MFSIEFLEKSWWALVSAVGGLIALLGKMGFIMYKKDLRLAKNEIKDDLDNQAQKRHEEVMGEIKTMKEDLSKVIENTNKTRARSREILDNVKK